jgi:hypothetical protein
MSVWTRLHDRSGTVLAGLDIPGEVQNTFVVERLSTVAVTGHLTAGVLNTSPSPWLRRSSSPARQIWITRGARGTRVARCVVLRRLRVGLLHA